MKWKIQEKETTIMLSNKDIYKIVSECHRFDKIEFHIQEASSDFVNVVMTKVLVTLQLNLKRGPKDFPAT